MEALGLNSDNVWRNAFAATAAISLVPNVILFAIPTSALTKRANGGINFQHVLLCFASGALLGDVVLHTIPHLLVEDHDHHNHNKKLAGAVEGLIEIKGHDGHDHFEIIYIGILVLLGFLFFFVTEKVAARHVHSGHLSKIEDCSMEETKEVTSCETVSDNTSGNIRRRFITASTNNHSFAQNSANDDTSDLDKMKSKSGNASFFPSFSKLNPSGWLNLLADSMHNFTDGIALGASFSSSSKSGSKNLGVAALFSIMFHEIPHELGDFSILIENGFSKWEAIQAQFITAIAAFFGTFLGLYAGINESLEKVMLATTAGGFLYIATVGILPNVINEKSSLLQLFLECLGFSVGIGFMVVVAYLEEIDEIQV